MTLQVTLNYQTIIFFCQITHTDDALISATVSDIESIISLSFSTICY